MKFLSQQKEVNYSILKSIQRQGNPSLVGLQDEKTISLSNTINTLKNDNLEMAVVIKDHREKNEKLLVNDIIYRNTRLKSLYKLKANNSRLGKAS